MESKKTCGNCAFMLFWDNSSDFGYCYKVREEIEVSGGTHSCKEWLDSRIRYSSLLNEITDERTLRWLNTVINEAYLERKGL